MKKGEPITHADLHLAIRAIIAGSEYRSFRLSTTSFEQHQNRIDVDYLVVIDGLKPREDFRSREPSRLVSWVKEAVRPRPIDGVPPLLASIGGMGHLRRVK